MVFVSNLRFPISIFRMPIMVIAIIGFWTTITHADGEPNYSRSGIYVAGGLSVGVDAAAQDAFNEIIATSFLESALVNTSDVFTNTTATFGVPSFIADVSAGAGFNLRVGYRTHRLAAEIHVERIPTVNVIRKGFVQRDLFGTFDNWVVTANLKVPLLAGRFQPYVLLGGGFISSDYHSLVETGDDFGKFEKSFNSTGGVLRSGGGVDFFFTENMFLNTDVTYVIAGGGAHDYVSVTLGLGWLFGDEG